MDSFPSQKRQKLDEKAEKLIFVGYDEKAKGYRLANIETNKIKISRDVKFLNKCTPEENIITNSELDEIEYCDNSSKNDDESPVEENVNDAADAEIIETNKKAEIVDELPEAVSNSDNLRKSARTNFGCRPRYLDDYVNCANVVQEEPKSYKDALSRSDSDKWLNAILDKINSIEMNGTYELVDLPFNRQAIGSKWVFKLKRDVEGNISKYKARLVAQGYSQKFGADYDEVFAPVVRITTFRTLLSVAANKNMIIKHYDIKTAFLNRRAGAT